MTLPSHIEALVEAVAVAADKPGHTVAGALTTLCRAVETELAQERARLSVLIAALPACYECGKPATLHADSGDYFCDAEHGLDKYDATDVRWAKGLREALGIAPPAVSSKALHKACRRAAK